MEASFSTPTTWLDAVEVVVDKSVSDNHESKSVTATCPVGKIAISGGADINQNDTQVSLISTAPEKGAVVGMACDSVRDR